MTAQTCTNCDRQIKDGYACTTCASAAKKHLWLIADLAQDLDAKRARLGSQAIEYSSPGVERPLPYDPRVAKVLVPITNALNGSHKIITEGRTSVPDTRRFTLRQMALWIAGNVGWLRTVPEGPEEFAEFARCFGMLERLFDRPPAALYLGMCSQRTDDDGICESVIYVPVGKEPGKADDAYVTCPGCATQHDVKERGEILWEAVLDYRATAKELVRLARIRYAAPPSRSMIYTYVKHGMLQVKGSRWEPDAEGRLRESDTYRIGDLEDAMRRWQEKHDREAAERKKKRRRVA